MNATPARTVPRPLLFLGPAVVALLVAAALWGWARFGEGVFFDTISGGLSACL